MLFNSITLEKPYHNLNTSTVGRCTSVARLSSVNVVRFWLDPLN